MSDLLARLRKTAQKNTKQPGPKCAVCSLPAEVLTAINQLKAEGIANTVLARTLTDEGYVTVKTNAVSRHFLDHARKR